MIPRTLLEGGESVDVRIPPPRSATVEPEAIPLDIVHEDACLVLVHKPHGLTVHPGSGQPDGTLANALVHHFQNLPEWIGSDRPGIVHRLDKDTSGIMVVAKTEAAQRTLSAAFADRKVHKTYLALVHGAPPRASGTIDAPIARDPQHRTRMTVRAGGRNAVTHYEVREALPQHTLLALKPVTGRTHQLRVHLRHLGLPIVGDPFYGERRAPGERRATRLMLHAWRLRFPHPVHEGEVSFTAPVPAAFQTTLDALREA